MPLPEYSGTLGLKRAAHLLRRITFGANKAQIDTFAGLTPQQAITQLLGQTLPDPVLPVNPDTGVEWMTTGHADPDEDDAPFQNYYKGWFIGQMMAAGIPAAQALAYSAREKVVFFLHTHFTCIQSKVDNSRSMYFQNQLYRMFALDRLDPDPEVNFKMLTVKVSVDNAMVRLLDGNLNVKGAVNENYARELFELYTIGRGLEGTLPEPGGPGDYILFTEKDVQEAAKVLSGWDVDTDFANIDPDTLLPRAKVKGSPTNASQHDNTVKIFSERFAGASITPDPLLVNGANATEESALDEITQLIDLIYSNFETAKHICWKIYRFYVHAPHTIPDSQAIDAAIITEMANTFVANGYKIQPVIENLLRSQHFYEAGGGVTDDNFGGIIKSPLDLITGTYKFFNITLPDMTADPVAFYEATGDILSNMNHFGMNFYEPFDVAGYEAWHQFPIYHRAWITPNYLSRRYTFMREFFDNTSSVRFNVDVYPFVRTTIPMTTSRNSLELIILLTNYLFPVTDNLTYDANADDTSGLTALRLNYFKSRFLNTGNVDEETYWTTRWDAGLDIEDLRFQLIFLFDALLQSPEYQLA